MALLFCDGFDHVDDAYEMLKWDSKGGGITYSSTYGRSGGWGALLDYATSWIQKNLTTAISTVITGGAFKFYSSQTNYPFFVFMDGSDGQVSICLLSDGSIQVRRGSGFGTIIGTSDPGILTLLAWHYVEVKVTISNTVGSVEVHVGGSQKYLLTGADTQYSANATVGAVRVLNNYGNPGLYVDDFYICDTTGTKNNDFLGDIKITTLYPTSDGNSSDFTPSTGTDHYALVDEPQLLTDSDYNESDTIGHKDLYGMTTFSGTSEIFGVQVTAAVINPESSAITAGAVSRSGGTPTDNDGSGHSVTQTMKAMSHIFEQEPTDAVDWTSAKINSAEFGYKIQS